MHHNFKILLYEILYHHFPRNHSDKREHQSHCFIFIYKVHLKLSTCIRGRSGRRTFQYNRHPRQRTPMLILYNPGDTPDSFLLSLLILLRTNDNHMIHDLILERRSLQHVIQNFRYRCIFHGHGNFHSLHFIVIVEKLVIRLFTQFIQYFNKTYRFFLHRQLGILSHTSCRHGENCKQR